jgi:hypothetical protein
MKLPTLKDWIRIIGLGVGQSSIICLYYVFITAYFNKSKTVIVDINAYNEAHIELIMMIIAAPAIIYTQIEAIKRTRGD